MISILLFSLLAWSGYGQVVAIQNELQNILYEYQDNPITVAINGVKPRNIFFNTNTGTIELNDNVHCSTFPLRAPRAVIYTTWLLPNDHWKNDSTVFKVIPPPLPVPTLAGKSGGEISQSKLLAQSGPEVHLECRYYGNPVISFTLAVYRHNKELFSREIANPEGAGIDSIAYEFFHQLKDNDVVIFKHIMLQFFGAKPRELEPMEFTITHAHKYRKVAVNNTVTVVDPVTGVESKRVIKSRFIRDDEDDY